MQVTVLFCRLKPEMGEALHAYVSTALREPLTGSSLGHTTSSHTPPGVPSGKGGAAWGASEGSLHSPPHPQACIPAYARAGTATAQAAARFEVSCLKLPRSAAQMI